MQLENKRIVLFIDLLGFKNFVTKNEQNDLERIKSVLDDFQKSLLSQRVYEHLQIGEIEKNISIFSDSVIISIEDKSPDQKYLGEIIEDIAQQIFECQISLFEHAILIRGGLTLGNIYHEKDMCFGTAQIKAYELESKYAVYPRILIDIEIINFLKKKRGKNFSRLEDNFISKDDTDFYFIDYAKQVKYYEESKNSFAGFKKLNGKKSRKIYYSKKLKIQLSKIISKEKDKKIKTKYIWLYNQFNKLQ